MASLKQVKVNCSSSGSLPLAKFKNIQGDLKSIESGRLDQLKNSILKQGIILPSVVWKKRFLLDGNQRHKAYTELRAEGYKLPNIPIIEVRAKTLQEAKTRILSYAVRYGEIDYTNYRAFAADINDLSFIPDLPSIGDITVEGPKGWQGSGEPLKEKYGVAPFSVINTREGSWQERKNWLPHMICSKCGTKEGVPHGFKAQNTDAKKAFP